MTSHTGADPSTNTGQGLGGTAVISYAQLRFCIDYFDAVPSRKVDMLGNHDIDLLSEVMNEYYGAQALPKAA